MSIDVAIGFVNQCDVNFGFGQRLGGFEATESTADDDHVGVLSGHGWQVFGGDARFAMRPVREQCRPGFGGHPKNL